MLLNIIYCSVFDSVENIVSCLMLLLFAEPSSSTTQNNTGLRDMQVWDLSKCAFVFSDSIGILKTELAKKGAGDYLIWDKDDKPAMDFVTACANIRSHIFGIQKKSLFDAKCKLYDID